MMSPYTERRQDTAIKSRADLRDRCLSCSVNMIRFVDAMPHTTSSRVVADQLLRSATSVGANIAEAKSASSKRDFIKYYEIALKSANETAYWLSLVRDALQTNTVELGILIQENGELSRIIGASLLTLKGKRA